jgi:Zn-dependent protease with chaperone function
MTIHFIQSAVLALLFFASLAALFSTVLYRVVGCKLTSLPCQIRSKILTIWLLSPIFIAVVLSLSGMLFSEMESHEMATEHCTSHNNSMAHLCWFEPAVHLSDYLWIAGMNIMALVIVFNVYKGIHLMLKQWRFQSTLHAVSEQQDNNIFRIASEHFFVFSSGLFLPQAFISSQLLEQLSVEELEVVLAHEQAHCRRRDVLRRLLLGFAGLFHLPATRQHLLSSLELAHEQICDNAAVQKVANRFLVAETIIKVTRQLQLLTPHSKMGITSFDGSHIDIRIQQLLEPPRPLNTYILFFSTAILSLIMCSVLRLTMPLHHLF